MSELPRTGTTHRVAFSVAPGQTITFAGLPPVLSTPSLIWQLENAALELMEPFLDPGWITVGTQVEIDHVGPALVGDEVECTASVVRGSGDEVTFRVEARREGRPICQGLHRRRIVSVEALKKRLRRPASD